MLARLHGFLRRTILPDQMSLTQALVLHTLRERGALRVTDLAGIEGVRQPTCTVLVNTMEAEGWVARTVDPSDRRAVLVELTDLGRKVLDELTRARTSALGHYLAGLTDDERDALAAALPGLTRLIELGAANQGGPDPGQG